MPPAAPPPMPRIDGLVYLNGETGLKPGDMVKVRIDRSGRVRPLGQPGGIITPLPSKPVGLTDWHFNPPPSGSCMPPCHPLSCPHHRSPSLALFARAREPAHTSLLPHEPLVPAQKWVLRGILGSGS